MLVSGFIGLAYEGIFSFLHNRRHKDIRHKRHKAVKAMDKKAMVQHNKFMHLEGSMIMYVIYNAETLEKLIDTVHHMHSVTTPNKRLFAGQHGTVMVKPMYGNIQGIQHYSINSLLYLEA